MAGNNVKAQWATMRGFGLVRNKFGEPQFDDFWNIPEEVEPFLTEEDWVYIGTQQATMEND